VEVDWQALSVLAPAELESAMLADLGRAMSGLTEDQEDELLAALPQPHAVLWLLDWLDFEVCQGSLLAYFYNSPGRHATQAADALDAIGAARMATVLRAAIDSMTTAEGEWTDRRAEMSELGEHVVARPYQGLSNAKRLSALTHDYWAAAKEDQWGDKLESFVVRAVATRATP
jgi:hypothetical protein